MARQPKNMPTVGDAAMSKAKNVSGAPERGTLVPDKGSKGAPALGTKANRGPTMERMGAAYHIGASIAAPTTDPAAGATQANGRIVKPAVKRVNQNFYASVADIQAS